MLKSLPRHTLHSKCDIHNFSAPWTACVPRPPLRLNQKFKIMNPTLPTDRPPVSPGGTSENSQAFQRLERGRRVSSPAGTADSGLEYVQNHKPQRRHEKTGVNRG